MWTDSRHIPGRAGRFSWQAPADVSAAIRATTRFSAGADGLDAAGTQHVAMELRDELKPAVIRPAPLTEAHLGEANLTEAVLFDAILGGAKLTGAVLVDAILPERTWAMRT